jgi:hypothetical protein
MKTLKEYVNEGLLKGQNKTLNDGEQFAHVVAEFEELKKLCTDLKNYEKFYAGRLYVAKMRIPLLVEYTGIKDKSYDTIHFSIPRYGDGVSWYCNCGLESETDRYGHKCLIIPGSSKMTRRPEQILKNAIEPLFIDFDAFVAWLSSQIKERNY